MHSFPYRVKTNTRQETADHRFFVLKELGYIVSRWFCENRKDAFPKKKIKQSVQLQTRYSPIGFAVEFGYAAISNDVLKTSRVLQQDRWMGFALSREPCV